MRQMREDVAVKFALGKIVGTGRQDDMSLWPTRSLMRPGARDATTLFSARAASVSTLMLTSPPPNP